MNLLSFLIAVVIVNLLFPYSSSYSELTLFPYSSSYSELTHFPYSSSYSELTLFPYSSSYSEPTLLVVIFFSNSCLQLCEMSNVKFLSVLTRK